MNPEQKPKILMLAGIIGGLMIVFGVMYFVFFRQPGEESTQQQQQQQQQPVAADPAPNPSGPGMPSVMPPGGGGPSAPGNPGSMTPPGGPITNIISNVPGITGMTPNNMTSRSALVDPFKGGPEKPKIRVVTPTLVPRDDRIRVISVPTPVSVRDKRWVPGTPVATPNVIEKAPAIGRHAGWMYNRTTGEVIAIFEDKDGKARTVRVGDNIDNTWQVKAIAPDYLLLVDRGNPRNEVQIPLQGLDTYPGKTKRTDVNTVPNMPPMP